MKKENEDGDDYEYIDMNNVTVDAPKEVKGKKPNLKLESIDLEEVKEVYEPPPTGQTDAKEGEKFNFDTRSQHSAASSCSSAKSEVIIDRIQQIKAEL